MSGLADKTADTSTNSAAPLRVLFIGNSFTHGNDLPAMVKSLSGQAKKPLSIKVESVTKGGARLEWHWNNGAALKKIREGGWTHVVLQDFSNIAVTDKASMFKHIRLFDAEIRSSGAKTLLYMTWTVKTKPQDQDPIAKAYLDIGKELGALVVPVGLARQAALKSNPAATIYAHDDKHPSPEGTYLAACLFYAMLSGQSPKGLPVNIPSPKDANTMSTKLSDKDAAFYQRIVEETLLTAN
jgi:hypothetical protein